MRTYAVIVISRELLERFKSERPDALRNLDVWYEVATKEHWRHIFDVKATYPQAEYVGGHTVFNIKGNRYRLVTTINYEEQMVFLERLMPHSEYDRGRWK